MTARWLRIILGGLLGAVIIAGLYFPVLKRRVKQAAKLQPQTEEQARRELTQPSATAAEPRVKARLFWASRGNDASLSPVTVDLPLSSDPILRSKQVLNTLIAGPVDAELRTLPPDAVLLAFYMLPDGTAIGDFSEALASSVPAGIDSEQRAVDSITRTLAANVPEIMRLKILIHGQEVETLAGHLDLANTFPVSPRATQAELASPLEPAAVSSFHPQSLTPIDSTGHTGAATNLTPPDTRNP